MPAMRTRPPALSAARLLAAPAVAAVVLAGVWVAGGLITDSFEGSFALTGVWFALAGAAVLALGLRSRALRWPAFAGYGVTVVAVSAYLGWSMFDDRVVDERVAVGTPAPAQPQAGGGGAEAPPQAGGGGAEAPPQNVLEATGAFRSGEHETTGQAAIVRLASGRRVVTLTGFETSPGPDLRVRIVPGATGDGGADGARDLGALKGNRGDQQYDVPDGFETRGSSVVIWCRAFSATFGHAVLRPA
jgi:hypothetical protein